MATKRMLVDGTHPEETRIVVTNGTRLEEFDFESQSRRQLRGNIYLAKVTRVEPSLQAAFIEYGGNRHGFLAFSEIHPDYYQIPVADREALMRDEEEAEREEHASAEAESIASVTDLASAESPDEMPASEGSEEDGDDHGHIEQAPANAEPVESVGGSDAMEDVQERRQRPPRRHQYKIQEVIKRRQVMLVQVVKEERGNKGAALTTYLSLAGRYSVLMPNTARGGGISRKITNAADRKRLKDIVGDLEVPQGQGIILRTAGASRTKAEVKRDFEYLQRLWENVRTLTLKSTAPCLVYEEGSLIKRTIRDLYSKEIDELFVAGDDAYREAKDFMRMIMPSHAKNVVLYKDDQPLFSKFNVEGQLDQMFSPQVTLPSGGYLVINPTEALVSIDVNSGRSTKEHNIEDTALQTNLEAAEEVARQLQAARPCRPHRHRLHRYGREPLEPGGGAQAQGRAQERPRPHPGRPHQPFRPDGNEPPAHPLRRGRELDAQMPDLPGHGSRALGREHRAHGHAQCRGPCAQEAGPVDQCAGAGRCGALHPQLEARHAVDARNEECAVDQPGRRRPCRAAAFRHRKGRAQDRDRRPAAAAACARRHHHHR